MTVWGEPTDLFGGGLDDFEFVGRGGHATVYRAVDTHLGRTVAVKVLRRQGAAAGAPAEARAQAKVSWHANVLTLHGSGTSPDGSPFLVLEYAPGGSLADRVAASGPLPTADWLRVGEQLASALAAAHAQGVIHCDVKPSNVLFAADGSVRLADFGIARSSVASTGTLDHFEGSLAFAPPELLDGQRPQPAGDVYGLALTLWFAATGQQPFGADHLPPAAVVARIHAEDLSFATAAPGAPAEVVELLDRCLRREPGDRPTAAAVAGLLRQPVTPGATDDEAVRSTLRPRLKVAGAALLVSALVGTVLFAAMRVPPGRPAAPSGADLCEQFSRSVDGRQRLINAVSQDIEQSSSPVDVIERSLVRYPRQFAGVLRPFLDSAAAAGGGSVAVTDSQVAQLSLAEVFRTLGGGKAFLFDGQAGTFDPTTLPTELRPAARSVSDAYSLAVKRCPSVVVDLIPAKARMNSAIFANLANPRFIDRFFLDPASVKLFDTTTVLLLVSMARGFFDGLLADHWDWFFRYLDRAPDTRAAVAFEHPDVLLAAARVRPDLMAYLARPDWLTDLKAGFARSSPAATVGMSALYGDQLRTLGIEGQ